jgi:hypothetical protein
MRKIVVSTVMLFMLCSVLSICTLAEPEWQVVWYHMDEAGVYDFDRMLARTTLPFHFAMDWGSGTILDSSQLLRSSTSETRVDKVGFQALCSFFVNEADEYTVVIRANNGVILHVDNKVVAHSWETVLPDGGGMRSVTAGVPLEIGFHTFELWYYEWDGSALVHFDTNIEPLGFEQTAALLTEALTENALLTVELETARQLLEESRK